MTNKKAFLEEEIPYGKLEKLGISRRAFLSMPKDLVDPIINGKVSPILKAHIKAKNGKTMEIPMKIQLSRDDDGSIKLLTYQRTKQIQNDFELTPRELERVKNGEVIRKELEENGIRMIVLAGFMSILSADFIRRYENAILNVHPSLIPAFCGAGFYGMKFIQLDSETNALIPKSVARVRIAEKLRDMEKIKDIELGANQKQAAQEGKPIQLNVGDQPVTVGVDLREPQGFKVVNGDMEEWNRQKKIKYDLEHEGYMGYVQTDENRWEYQKFVDKQTNKESVQTSLKKEEKKSSGLKL